MKKMILLSLDNQPQKKSNDRTSNINPISGDKKEQLEESFNNASTSLYTRAYYAENNNY